MPCALDDTTSHLSPDSTPLLEPCNFIIRQLLRSVIDRLFIINWSFAHFVSWSLRFVINGDDDDDEYNYRFDLRQVKIALGYE